MGSQSDWETMKHAADILEQLNIPYEQNIVSAHRTPDRMSEYAKSAAERGIKVIIAGAGGQHICLAWLRHKPSCLFLEFLLKAAP